MPNDHYVPQFLLRGFATGKRKQLYAFDKLDGRTFRSSVRNLACERNFYEPHEDEELSGLDAWIGQAETSIAPMIQQIRERKSLHWLIPTQRKWIAAFTVLQILRTPNHREKCADVNKQITDVLIKMGADPYNVKNFRPMTDAQLHDSSLAYIRDLTLELYPHVLDKSWLLLEADECGPFWISDNPVVMTNTLNPGDGIRGTLGLRVRGIEIYLPISSRLTLGFLCPTAEQQVRENSSLPHRIMEFSAAFSGRIPVPIDRQNVIFQNSLQISRAERYVYSPHNDFSLAADMLNEEPELRTGPRLGFARTRRRGNRRPAARC